MCASDVEVASPVALHPLPSLAEPSFVLVYTLLPCGRPGVGLMVTRWLPPIRASHSNFTMPSIRCV